MLLTSGSGCKIRTANTVSQRKVEDNGTEMHKELRWCSPPLNSDSILVYGFCYYKNLKTNPPSFGGGYVTDGDISPDDLVINSTCRIGLLLKGDAGMLMKQALYKWSQALDTLSRGLDNRLIVTIYNYRSKKMDCFGFNPEHLSDSSLCYNNRIVYAYNFNVIDSIQRLLGVDSLYCK